MSYFTYTIEHAKFVQELRDQGYTWPEIEVEFAKEFGEAPSHDSIRQRTKQIILNLEPDEEEIIEIPVKRRARSFEELPDYLLYSPKKKITPGPAASKGTALIIPDCHIPYYDKRAYDLMLEVAQDTKDLKEIVILGDYADFYAVNSHGKHPKFGHVLIDEINQVRMELERLAKMFPKVKRVFISGNHEYRLERYIYDRAPDLFSLIDTPTILELDRLGYEFVPYDSKQKYQIMGSRLYARHEPIAGGEHVAAGTVNKAGCSMVFGHSHKIQQYRKVFINDEDHMAACVGWLGDKDHQVMGYLKQHAQWSLGFGLAHVMEDRNFFLDIKHIIDYKVWHNGKVYVG